MSEQKARCKTEDCNRWSLKNDEYCFFCSDKISPERKQSARSKGGSNSKRFPLVKELRDLPQKFDEPQELGLVLDSLIANNWEKSNRPANAKIVLQAIQTKIELWYFGLALERLRLAEQRFFELESGSYLDLEVTEDGR